MKIKTTLLSASVTVLLVSHIAFSTMAQAQDALTAIQRDFEDSAKWNKLPNGYNWVETGGVSDSACIVIQRENTHDYGTLGIIRLKNPEPGTYLLSADMKVEEFGDGKASGSIYIDLNQDGKYVAIKPNGISSGPTGGAWVKVEGQVSVPDGITEGWIGAIIPKGQTGKVSIDNLMFKKVE
jgi:hypothetical protein